MVCSRIESTIANIIFALLASVPVKNWSNLSSDKWIGASPHDLTILQELPGGLQTQIAGEPVQVVRV